MGFEPDGDGEFAYCFVEKTALNTTQVADQLAKVAGVRNRDVSFSGMKDRQASTRQWFSVHLPGRQSPDFENVRPQGWSVLKATRHARKLRRGTHQSNRFGITIRETVASVVVDAFQEIAGTGVPNYFGPQRFGHQGRNLQLIDRLAQGGKANRRLNSVALSAARAWAFNNWLSERVDAGNWLQVAEGDRVMLRGSHSHFPVEIREQDALNQRIQEQDCDLALPLPGEAEAPQNWQAWFARNRVQIGWRRSRLLAQNVEVNVLDSATVHLAFTLESGAFATALLRELVKWETP